ncbi:hypothetical protein [Brevibacterium spongiae]|uniref:hypothetical protein n=1 Tax=Brevibacterium spongiae TaxID=2909672 RepID=UPI003211C4C1
MYQPAAGVLADEELDEDELDEASEDELDFEESFDDSEGDELEELTVLDVEERESVA